jgi:23S rRNA pseudoU1915 N3-methylase RlmH
VVSEMMEMGSEVMELSDSEKKEIMFNIKGIDGLSDAAYTNRE